ncbi:MAG: hypothetical protein JRI68_35455 [Deltaproteobacteria bacterium]|nr:hypothetical protein [Deltaproteobacteria bacterium]
MDLWDEGCRLGSLALAGLVVSTAGCGLSETECNVLRSEAFDVINESHTCNDDTDCLASEWPGCGKPLNVKNEARVKPLKDKFHEGKCKEPTRDCREIPEVYCKQGLCVFRETVGGENPTKE